MDGARSVGEMQPTRRVRAAVAIVVGQVIGGSVAAVVLEAPWLLVATVLSAIVAVFPLRRWSTTRREEPSSTEWLMATGNVVLNAMSGALVALVFGAIAWAVAWTLDQLEWASPASTTWAQWTTAVVLVIVPKSTAETLEMIQPTTARFELPLRQKELQGGVFWWIGFFVLVGAIVAAWTRFGFEDDLTKWIWVLAVAIGSSATVPGGPTVEADDRYESVVAALAAALERAGYDAAVNPVTNDVEVDRSLGDVDILARAPGRPAVLVDVRLECGTVSWHEATKVVTSAAVCGRWLDDGFEVQPLLVLVDAVADDTVATYLGDTGLCVVEYRLESGRMTMTPDHEELRGIVAPALADVHDANDAGAGGGKVQHA